VILSPDRISFDRITDHVWQGSRIATLDDYHRLRAQGVRACVDMKEEGPDLWEFDAFLWLPTPDHEPPSQLHLRMGIGFLRHCEEARLPVFVSCLAGVGRSATLVLAHLLAGRLRTVELRDALDFLTARRPVVRLTPLQAEAAVQAARSYVGPDVPPAQRVQRKNGEGAEVQGE
jgi:Dual specificity phosphatase, catalytic domain